MISANAGSGTTPEPVSAGELLRRYLASACDSEASSLLEILFTDHIIGWCAEAARRSLRRYGWRGGDPLDQEAEIQAEVLLQMTTRLYEARRNPESAGIANLRAYVFAVSGNAVFTRVRARCPYHVQLQNRIRYLLRSDRRFAIWQSPNGEWLCGLALWTGRDDRSDAPPIESGPAPLDQLIENSFRASATPIEMPDLVEQIAAALGIVEVQQRSWRETGDVAGSTQGSDRALIDRESLDALWNEVTLLPPQQRAAILLNLRDGEGHGVIELLPATGAASFAEIADALGMTVERLAGLWNDLPLGDSRIAELLGVTRQQVINLRKSGRARLGRRQKNADGNTLAQSSSGKLMRTLSAREDA